MHSLLGWFACILHFVSSGTVTIADLQNPSGDNVYSRFHIKDITLDGSHIQGVALHVTNSPDDNGNLDHWSVTAPLVYALPNKGSMGGLINEHEAHDRIVLIDRGEIISIAHQIHIAQHAGAVAVIIVDFPNTNEKNTALHAVIRASTDHAEIWESLTLPSVIVSHRHYERLKRGMDLVHGDIHHGYGDQYVMAESEFAGWIVHHHQDEQYAWNDEL